MNIKERQETLDEIRSQINDAVLKAYELEELMTGRMKRQWESKVILPAWGVVDFIDKLKASGDELSKGVTPQLPEL